MWFLWAIGLLVVSYTISALTAKKSKVVNEKPALLADFTFPQHEEGTPEAVVFGDVWIEDPMILYYGNLTATPIRQSSGSGKKS